jgi:prepilin-type N-terminal cleavage/methylation domain-containing protein
MKQTPQIGVAALRNNGARGFTLLEMLISLLILAVVSGAVFAQINRMQQRSSSEAIKVDMSQQARDFLDQTVRDLHMAGYPNASMYSNPTTYPWMVAAGLVSVSPTQILLEGDVNNDGNVYSVKIWYVAADPSDPNCPCIRRSAIAKIDADSFSQPTSNYTETQYVLPPGTGSGQSGEDLFAYYDQNGNVVNIAGGTDISTPAGQALISLIKTVKINLSLSTRDPETNSFTRTSMSATSRLN